MVRLIRSKGVGVYFVSQNPLDIPDVVLGQLGNRVQHALRAFTPRDQKAVSAAAQTFRQNPKLKVETVITELGVGEALVSMLDEEGKPGIVDRAKIVPPRSQVGAITPEQRKQIIQSSDRGRPLREGGRSRIGLRKIAGAGHGKSRNRRRARRLPLTPAPTRKAVQAIDFSSSFPADGWPARRRARFHGDQYGEERGSGREQSDGPADRAGIARQLPGRQPPPVGRRWDRNHAPRRRQLPNHYFFGEGLGLAAALSSFFALLSAFTSTSFAVIVYMIVTLSPTLRSPVTFVLESRSTSNCLLALHDHDHAVTHFHDRSGDLIGFRARGEGGAAQGECPCGDQTE